MKLSRARVVTGSDQAPNRPPRLPQTINLDVEEFKLAVQSDQTNVPLILETAETAAAPFSRTHPKQAQAGGVERNPHSPFAASPYPATPQSQQVEAAFESRHPVRPADVKIAGEDAEEFSDNPDEESNDDSRHSGCDRMLPTDLDLQEQEYFAGSLLSLIDNGKGEFLLESNTMKTDKLKTFVVASVYVISQSSAVNNLEQMSVKALVTQIPNLLNMTKPKRKDQKLRMIYNSIFKMIVNAKIKHARQNFPSKFDIFLNEYANEQKDDLKKMLVSSKAPSKKKLKMIFGRHPEIRAEFQRILEQRLFLKEYLGKRLSKSEQIYRKFHELYKRYGDDPVSISKVLGTTFKAFPWSISEIKSSCEILHQITIECLVQAKKDTCVENQIKSSLQAEVPGLMLGKRSPTRTTPTPAVIPPPEAGIVVPEARYAKPAHPVVFVPRAPAFHLPSPPSVSAAPTVDLPVAAPAKPGLSGAVAPPTNGQAVWSKSLESPSSAFSFVFLRDINPHVPWKPQHFDF